MRAKLYAAIYNPRMGNYKHFALYLKNGEEDTIYEAIGDWPNFEHNIIVNSSPLKTTRFLAMMLVGEINQAEVPTVKRILEQARVDNETVHWNCQDVVVENADEIVNDCLTTDDDDWTGKNKGRDQLMQHYGPM
ncbi:hypothetical protein H2204_014873 [Knufia peltigerae]|uniref:Uncharacterized protein n=1 Tax=Knufia peltigerae TaxID=1002370 RepID=A0AA39CLN5_9EURO|nr:hypothetical protein H2204_014873 [Knufia peltigerae]